MTTAAEDLDLLRDIVAAELGRAGDRGWSTAEDDFWCRVTPEGGVLPRQGWKLHVSATMLSAPVVLSRVSRVLVGAGCAFKFPARLSGYWELLEAHCSRAQAGKFVTVYPRDDAEAVRLAALLDEATLGLPGPAILSDRPYRPGGIVHYRYGAFGGHRVLGNDGFYEIRLRSPEGRFVLDERLPRYSPPPFAACPFEAPEAERRPGAGAVMLNDRFVVREAVRHANRGGVYLAEDTKTGRQVVVKEGRPHACADLSGGDARDRIRLEHSVLERLAGSGAVPALVDFFEHGGHAFLVEEFLPGTTLQRWSGRHAGPLGADGFGDRVERVLPIAGRLVGLLRAVHEHGLVFRDLSPNNVMVLPDGGLRLIDPECAAVPGTVVMVSGTRGYLAPELAAHWKRFRPAPEASADLYALGAVVYFLAVGADPDPSTPSRIAAVSEANPTLALLRPLVEGLMAAEPERRWPLERCERFLAGLTPATPLSGAGSRAPGSVDRLIGDGIAHLVETVEALGDGLSPWPGPASGDEPDPCSVSGGAAGLLGVLTRALPEADTAGAVTALSGRLRRRLAEEDEWRPGLYFGRSGAVWALYDAATALGDADLARFAVRAAALLPTDHPSPDVTHGLAGCGMAVLHLALRTGDPVLRERATATFQHLHDARSSLDGHPHWPTPADFDSGLAGADHFGFAHGIAGIGTALLHASLVLDRPDWAATADGIARALSAYADLDGDTAWWATLRAEPESTRPRWPHWCSGSSGIGSFLVRHWNATGDERSLVLARAAAAAVHRTRWRSDTAWCHGLPGDAEFLLDMADFTGDDRYRLQAADLAACLETRAAEHSGLLLVSDRGDRPGPAFLGGTAGTVAFLLRLRQRRPRLWMLDDALEPTSPAGGR
ncbi:class IV lanthionine synthetase LanL [Planomonospora sp. ID82291]|uniref:class IV lanthionine synthetase LanL n=1 Tax=Planomonospora sp. ID82291 TaxID=2738136 RepID=UPI0018C3E31C|nr:class IV lanthionine synthetase LanL [Planomonospora sp. ID82291]MBG0814090.1 protein kinase/lanthionine synthetase C family protein [Planomonospora sp. ID82291]